MENISQKEILQELAGGEIQTSESAITPEEPADIIVATKDKDGEK